MTTDRNKVHALDPTDGTPGQVPTINPAGTAVEWDTPAGGGGSLAVEDEGAEIIATASRLNFTGAGVTVTDAGSGEATVTIPGGSGGGSGSSYPPGSADAPPVSPNAKDDEFDGTSSATWTATPVAPSVTDRNTTRPSHLYIKAAGSGSNLVGRHQPIPAAFPFTVTTKLASSTGRANFHRGGGIILLPAAPTAASPELYIGVVYNTNGVECVRVYYTNGTTFGNQSTFPGNRVGLPARPHYLRVVATSATSISTYMSTDGWAWVPIEVGYTVPFAIGRVGLGLSEETALGGVEAFFDFFRVT